MENSASPPDRPAKRRCTLNKNYAEDPPDSDSDSEDVNEEDTDSGDEDPDFQASDTDSGEDDFGSDASDTDSDSDFGLDDEDDRDEALRESRLEALVIIAELAGINVSKKSIVETSAAFSACRMARRRGASVSQIADYLGVQDPNVIQEARLEFERILSLGEDVDKVEDSHFGRGCPIWLKNINSEILFACILGQAMNFKEARRATREALEALPDEISERIKSLVSRGGMEWVDGLAPSFIRVIGAAFEAVEKKVVLPDIEGLRQLFKDESMSSVGLRGRSRIFGHCLKDAPPPGFVCVILSYTLEGVHCIARGFVASSTPTKDLVKKAVESARDVKLGGGLLLDKAVGLDFGVVHGSHHHVFALKRLPQNLKLGERNIRLTADIVSTPRMKIRSFVAKEGGVKSLWRGSIEISFRLCDSIAQVLETTRDEIEKNVKIRAVVEPCDFSSWRTYLWPCDKDGNRTGKKEVLFHVNHKPLRAFLKRVGTSFVLRQDSDVLQVARRLHRLGTKRPVHILVSQERGQWTPKLANNQVKKWGFRSRSRL